MALCGMSSSLIISTFTVFVSLVSNISHIIIIFVIKNFYLVVGIRDVIKPRTFRFPNW